MQRPMVEAGLFPRMMDRRPLQMVKIKTKLLLPFLPGHQTVVSSSCPAVPHTCCSPDTIHLDHRVSVSPFCNTLTDK